MSDSLRLDGRAVLVTGGTRGIGRAIAERFLTAGADVLVCARNAPESLPACEGREAVFTSANARSAEDAARVVEETVNRFGRLDVLVNNAGGSPPVDAATASPRLATAVVELNLLGPLHFAQGANAVMQARPEGGTIVNVASVSGTRPSPGTAAYGAAKAGLLNLTASLAVEWAPRVRVNAIAAGMIRTESTDAHYGDAESLARGEETVPLGRLGEPREVADLCLFLASPLASYISGATVLLHGGGERPAFLGAVDSDHG